MLVLLRLMRASMSSTHAAWSAALVPHGSGMPGLMAPPGQAVRQSRGAYGERRGTLGK